MQKLRRTFCLSLSLCFLSWLLLIPAAISQQISREPIPINQYGIRSSNPYVVERFVKDGKTIDKVMVPPSECPATFVAQAAAIPEVNVAAGINVLSNVPAMTWVFGCSATSAAMMFGYYDNTGYPNMYTGPTNGGIFPMTNAAWGTVVINGGSQALCPLSATRLGLDGRATRGHVDDYWVSYDSSAPDPYIGNWTEHTHGLCTADYMGTNQYKYGSTDGATWFWYYPDGSPLYNYDASSSSSRDGTFGMRLFAESRGYQVVANFFQLIYGYDGNTLGFTFANFKNEIDAGRPVMIQLEGHSMLGYGYNDTGQTIYIHDTWNYDNHTMTWGGSYSGMQHYAVTVFRLAAPTTTTPTLTTTAVSSITATSASSGGNITSDGGASVTARGVCWSKSANPTINDSHTTSGTGTGSFSSSMTRLSPGTVYHVRAYATNSVGTAYGSDRQFTTSIVRLPCLPILLD